MISKGHWFPDRRSFLSRLIRQWPFLLVLIPTMTEWLDDGTFVRGWRAWVTDVVMTIVTGFLVWMLRKRGRRIEEMAVMDELTGLFNSSYMRWELDYHVRSALRTGGPLTLLFMDLDNFKSVNDSRGHGVGSDMLAYFGRLVGTVVRRDKDLCFRFGGDEFVILCPQTGQAAAEEVARRLREAVLFSPELKANGVTVSLGIAEYRPGETAKDLLARADTALYAIKRNGKNGIGVAP
jgi:diguanylate cyclase